MWSEGGAKYVNQQNLEKPDAKASDLQNRVDLDGMGLGADTKKGCYSIKRSEIWFHASTKEGKT